MEENFYVEFLSTFMNSRLCSVNEVRNAAAKQQCISTLIKELARGLTQKGPYLAIYMRNPLCNLSCEKPQETSLPSYLIWRWSDEEVPI